MTALASTRLYRHVDPFFHSQYKLGRETAEADRCLHVVQGENPKTDLVKILQVIPQIIIIERTIWSIVYNTQYYVKSD